MNSKLLVKSRVRIFSLVALSLVLAMVIHNARGLECTGCHEDVKYSSPAHPALTCQECHTDIRTTRHRADDPARIRGEAVCLQCHEMPPLFAKLPHGELGCARCHGVPHESAAAPLQSCNECHSDALQAVRHSVHADNVTCQDCHGAAHEVPGTASRDCEMYSVNQVTRCGACHSEPPGLVESYVNSVHGRGLLFAGLEVAAPSCSACHGGHRILSVNDEKAPTSHENSPKTCGRCHITVFETWRKGSIHGSLWEEGSADGPVCTTCHASHAIADPKMPRPHLGFANECGDCHGKLYSSYQGNFHGKFTQFGLVTSATCSDCHTSHRILPADDPGSSVHPDRVGETCGKCHEGVGGAFLQIDAHSDPTAPDKNRYVYYASLFMMGLLIGVFALFGIHDLLWLQRSAIGWFRGEFAPQRVSEDQPYVRRFRGSYIVLHVIVILTFLLLALTGLPLKFHTAAWAKTLMTLVGGIDSARALHRIAAIATFGYMAFHLVHIFVRWLMRREHGLFQGPNSMVPQCQDVKDVIANLRYFLYLGPRPEVDRWTYWEKFDYLAVFWGVLLIGLSGLMLWWPTFFTNFLPGWTINVAYVVHSEEALLATGFIFVFHFIHTHLRPGSFPMDPVVFTGRMPLEKFKRERPREYRRMLDEGSLEAALCKAPSKEEMGWVWVFGFTALTTGLALAVSIFWALLTQ